MLDFLATQPWESFFLFFFFSYYGDPLPFRRSWKDIAFLSFFSSINPRVRLFLVSNSCSCHFPPPPSTAVLEVSHPLSLLFCLVGLFLFFFQAFFLLYLVKIVLIVPFPPPPDGQILSPSTSFSGKSPFFIEELRG